MRVEWTDYAEMRRDQIGDYILDSFGAKRMAKFMQEVDSAVSMLVRNLALSLTSRERKTESQTAE